MRGAAAVILVLGLLMVGCDQGAVEETTVSATSTPPTTATSSTTSTNTVPVTTSTPASSTSEAGEVWDLVYISDSEGWGVAAEYGERIERDLGATVEVHDLWTSFLSAGNLLAKLRGKDDGWLTSSGSGRQNLLTLIPEAEVIVVIGLPKGLETTNPPWDWPCGWSFQETDSGCAETTEVCGPETWGRYEADLGAIFEEIFALRGGEPVILRTTDYFITWGDLATWRACAHEGVCKRCWAEFSDAIHRAAAAHGVPVAGLLTAFSGQDLDRDVPREYFSDDYHPSEAGAAAIADVLAALGYEPVAP